MPRSDAAGGVLCFTGPRARFLDSYYVVHILVFAAYAAYRAFLLPANKVSFLYQETGILGLKIPREIEILVLLLILLCSRYYNSATVDHFLGHVALFGKTYILAMLWNIDKRLMSWFLILIMILFLLLRNPRYRGPHKVRTLNAGNFKEAVISLPRAAAKDPRKSQKIPRAWLVEFTASWHTGARLYEPTVAELSERFTTDDLVFGRVDVAKWKELAETYDINTDSTSVQLPSYIMFEDGKETKRLPPLNKKKEPIKTMIRKEGIIQYFELDRRMLESRARRH